MTTKGVKMKSFSVWHPLISKVAVATTALGLTFGAMSCSGTKYQIKTSCSGIEYPKKPTPYDKLFERHCEIYGYGNEDNATWSIKGDLDDVPYSSPYEVVKALEKEGKIKSVMDIYRFVKEDDIVLEEVGSGYAKNKEYEKAMKIANFLEDKGNMGGAGSIYYTIGSNKNDIEIIRKAAKYLEKGERWFLAADAYGDLGMTEKEAECESKEGWYETAAKDYEKIKVYDKAAENYDLAKKCEKAVLNYDRAGEYIIIAIIYKRLGKMGNAAKYYEKAGWYGYATKYYDKAGMHEDAERCRKKAKEQQQK